MGSAVVAERTAEIAPELTVDQRVGRAAWHGVLIGLVGMTALGTGLGLATGYDMIGSLGLGAFAGVWGGPGFGGMLGAVLAYAARRAPRERARRDRHRGRTANPARAWTDHHADRTRPSPSAPRGSRMKLHDASAGPPCHRWRRRPHRRQ